MRFSRICVIVLDSVGIGELPDAERFGDAGANTLGHIAEQVPALSLPNLQQVGLGCIAPISGLPPVENPKAAYGKMAEVSEGKDTMTGHWELMGLKTTTPFYTYPEGFPQDLLAQFELETGRKVIGNKPASGTEILDELGEEQMRTGAWIVYTSADSVFQLAAHEDIIPLSELYAACEVARRLTLEGPHAVGRVIARPYVGQPGSFKRTSNRHDYAIKPPASTALNALKDAGLDSIGVGKIGDIFSMKGISASHPTHSNQDGVDKTIQVLQSDFKGLLFVNLVEFDSLYGHRRDPIGYAGALEDFDRRLPEIMDLIGPKDLLVITADHGNDPTYQGTDHTREYVPLLVWSPTLQPGQALGIRNTFADIAATIVDNFSVPYSGIGTSFLGELKEHYEEKEGNTMTSISIVQQIEEAVQYLQTRMPFQPEVGLILGSGLGVMADTMEDATIISYADIPHFPVSTVEGHASELVAGTISGKRVVVMKGRFHLYEGYDVQHVTLPIRVMKELGVHTLIVTNAAGGIKTSYQPGDLMLIQDHINFTARNPLIGPHDNKLGVRFPDMSDAYNAELRDIAKQIAVEQGIALQEGVYIGLLGPSYETPAEIRMMRLLGADAVGMSTVPEVIVARHAGLKVLGISCISNMASGILDQPLSHHEVMETAERVKHKFIRLVKGIIPRV
jgi:phosphopentomutase